MKKILCSIRDTLVGVNLPVFECDSEARAIRDFGDACTNDKLPIASHPSDYALVELADYDPESMTLTPLAVVKTLAHATDFAKKEVK